MGSVTTRLTELIIRMVLVAAAVFVWLGLHRRGQTRVHVLRSHTIKAANMPENSFVAYEVSNVGLFWLCAGAGMCQGASSCDLTTSNETRCCSSSASNYWGSVLRTSDLLYGVPSQNVYIFIEGVGRLTSIVLSRTHACSPCRASSSFLHICNSLVQCT